MSLPSPSAPRLRLYAAALEQARQMGDPNDAARWFAQHGLLAITDHPSLPAAVRPPLVVAAQRNAAANLLRVHRFQAIADALEGYPFVPLKGLHLLATVYREDPESRVLTDLDLLIREAEVSPVLDRLDALGYRESAASRRAAAHRHERVLSDGTLTVEIHTRLGVNHGRASRWRDLEPVPGTVHDRTCHLLDAETTLVHLVTHFVRHGPYTRLGWAEDIARWREAALHRPGEAPPEIERAFRIARRLGAERSFTAGLDALAAVFGEEFLGEDPDTGPWRADDPLLRFHRRLIWGHLARHPLHCGLASNAARRNLSALLLADRPTDAWSFLVDKGQELRLRWVGGD